MGSDDSGDAQALRDAIATGDTAFFQVERLNAEAARCYEAADKIKSLKRRVEAFGYCQAISKRADFILANVDAIDNAVLSASPPGSSSHGWVPNAAAGAAYNKTYAHFRNKSPAQIQAAYNQVVGQADTPSRAPALDALQDLLNGSGYHPPSSRSHKVPPAPTPDPRTRPTPEPTEPPDIGATPDPGETAEPVPMSDRGDPDQMGAASIRRRPQRLASHNPQKLVNALMPLADYWLVDTSAGLTLHFIEDCPACIASGAEAQELDEIEHPIALAERLSAHPCGTCMRMQEASIKDGFLTGGVTAFKTIAIWRDRVEYEGPEWLGLSRKKVTIALDEIEAVNFRSPTDLVLDTAQGRLKFSFSRPVNGDIAREAFRRLGWTFEDG